MSLLKAAAIQLNSQPNVEKSMENVRHWVEMAVNEGAELICLPENFSFMGDEREKLNRAGDIATIVEEQLPQWAVEFDITILGGGYPASAGEGKIFNRSVLILPDGSVAATYDKIHLFDVDVSDEETWRESATVQGGKPEGVVYKSRSLPAIGFSICYDLRFPELFRELVEKGAEFITVPSAFTRPTGEAHWEVLLRARAIENSVYIIAPAQTGRHGEKRQTYGHSMIIDPWGNVLMNAGTEPGIITAEIDMQQLHEIRRKLPSIEHRRL